MISVIVPVYNTEKYLKKCIESIKAQTYGNLEIILVDDGSPDGAGLVCDELAKTDSRIKVIHKMNGGLSSARNAGIEISKGDYLGFVDSDDWIAPDMYKTLYDRLVLSDADISCCNIMRVRRNEEIPVIKDLDLDSVFSGREAALRVLDFNEKILFSVANKLFRRNLFDNLRFKEGVLFEDFQIMPYLLMRAGKVICSGKPLYMYYESESSILRSDYSIRFYDYVRICRGNIKYYKDYCPEGYDRIREIYIGKCLDIIFRSYKSREWDEQRREITEDLKKMSQTDIYDKLRRNIRLKLQLLFISPELYYVSALMNRKLKTFLRRDEIVYDTANGF